MPDSGTGGAKSKKPVPRLPQVGTGGPNKGIKPKPADESPPQELGGQALAFRFGELIDRGGAVRQVSPIDREAPPGPPGPPDPDPDPRFRGPPNPVPPDPGTEPPPDPRFRGPPPPIPPDPGNDPPPDPRHPAPGPGPSPLPPPPMPFPNPGPTPSPPPPPAERARASTGRGRRRVFIDGVEVFDEQEDAAELTPRLLPDGTDASDSLDEQGRLKSFRFFPLPFGRHSSGEAAVAKAEVEAFSEEFVALLAENQVRIDRYKMYREEAEFPRTRSMMGEFASTDVSDYGRKKSGGNELRHTLTIPFPQALAVKHTYRLAGRLPEFAVDRRDESPQERYRAETMTKLAWAIEHASDGEQQIATAGWDASQLGAACYDVYQSPTRGIPVYRALDPTGVLVVPGTEREHDFERVYRFWDVTKRSLEAKYGSRHFRGMPVAVPQLQSNAHKRGDTEMVTVVQVSDRYRKLQFALGGGGVALDEWRHDLGFVPYVVQPNVGPERDIWGWADYEFYRVLGQYFEQFLSREADIIKANAGGAYFSKRTGLSPETIKGIIRDGGVADIKLDGTIEPIKTPEAPKFIHEHGQLVMELIEMMSFAPPAAWGKGFTSSGSDRSLQLMPQLELTGLKQINAASAMQRLYSMAFQIAQAKTAGPTTYRGSAVKGNKRVAFAPFVLGPGLAPAQIEGDDGPIEVPRDLEELFGGDYCMRVIWANRIDPDDPAFITSEITKFRQGTQSLETTLENLGVNEPADEMRKIEAEAERFPWLNNGMIALIKAQLAGVGAGEAGAGQGAGGGGDQSQPWGNDMSALATMSQPGGDALQQDALQRDLGGPGVPSGGA